jgi:hypothetical protein
VVVAAALLGTFAARAAAESEGAGDPYLTNAIVASTRYSPYWGYVYSPYGDFIRAQGDFLIKIQEAALLREEVRRSKLKTRRAELEEWEWERDFLATARRNERERVQRREVEYSRDSPAFDEIIGGEPLNTLFVALGRRPTLDAEGSIPVDAEWLAHVHFTVGGRGNLGLLKGDTVFWPQLLLRPEFADERDRFDKLLASAKKQLLGRRTADPQTLQELRRGVGECRERLRQQLRSGGEDPDWNMLHYADAKRFLSDVESAIATLERPDAAFYLAPLEGRTVAELVVYMKKHGVRFAAATPGCERYYVTLRTALADEVRRLVPPSSSNGSPSEP